MSHQDPFVAACAAALDKKRGERVAPIAEFFDSPRVEKILHAIAWRYGLGEQEVDDLRQKLAILFNDQLFDTLREPEAVYAVLYSAAWRLGSTQVRKQTETSLEDLADRAQGGASTGLGADEMIGFLLHEQHGLEEQMDEQVLNRIDRESAIEAFNRCYVGGQLGRTSSKPRRSGKPKAPPVENASQRRLRDIRQQLQLTVQAFAQQLDVDASRMQSLLYGPAARIPDELLGLAEKLVKERPRAVSSQSAWLRDAPMRDIVVSWLRQLQMLAPATPNRTDESLELEKGLLSGLAGILGVNRSTVWRWFDQGQKPRVREIEQFNRTVNKQVSLTSSALAGSAASRSAL